MGRPEAKGMAAWNGVTACVLLFKGTNEEFHSQMGNALLSLKLNETESYKLIFVFDLFGNVLLIPQSSYLIQVR